MGTVDDELRRPTRIEEGHLPERPPTTSDGTRGRTITTAAAYLAVSILWLRATPLLHITNSFVGASSDPYAHMWFLAWWPHALFHGLNPLFTHSVWAPQGFNLALTTSDPGPALLLAPLTATLGPIVSFNLITILAPALSGWTGYLLCREVTGRHGAALVGGNVFGFSSYELARLHAGQPNLELTFLVPVCVLVVIRSLRGSIAGRRSVTLLTLALFGQFLISPEVFATLTVFGALTLALAALLVRPAERANIARTSVLIAAAYGLTGLIVSPFVIYALASPAPVRPVFIQLFSSDLLGFVVPTGLTRIGSREFAHVAARLSSPSGDTYLGWALLVAVALFVVRFRKSREAWILAGSFVLISIASLGPALHVDGRVHLTLPYALVQHLPLVRYAIPARFVLYDFLLAAVMLSMWLAAPSRGWQRTGRWVLAGLVVVSLLPAPSFAPARQARTPEFFARGIYQRYLRPDENVLIVPSPWNGGSMLWQAQSHFAYRMPNGYVSAALPVQELSSPLFYSMFWGRLFAGARERLPAYLRSHQIRDIILFDGVAGPWRELFDSVDPSPTHVAGVLVFHVPP